MSGEASQTTATLFLKSLEPSEHSSGQDGRRLRHTVSLRTQGGGAVTSTSGHLKARRRFDVQVVYLDLSAIVGGQKNKIIITNMLSPTRECDRAASTDRHPKCMDGRSEKEADVLTLQAHSFIT